MTNIVLVPKEKPEISSRDNIRSSMEVGGSITSDEFWNADTVKVIADVIIDNGVTVNIAAGTKIEFQDYYKIDVKGTILAYGDADNRINFISSHPEFFMLDYNEIGAWNGLKFNAVSNQNERSVLEYCIFEYSKSFEEKGGVLNIINTSKLAVVNCIFRNNIADFGSAISCEYNSAPQIVGNLFENNSAFISGSPIYCSYSYPRISNNTIVSNQVINEEVFHETAAIHTFISKPQLANNIIWNNVTNFYDPQQLMNCKSYYTTYNDIEFGHEGKGNINSDPIFSGSGEYFYSLEANSPCVDAGSFEFPFGTVLSEFDLAGNTRVINDSIDMGALEWSEVGVEDSDIFKSIFTLINYPNPFNPSTTISFNLAAVSNVSLAVYNVRGQKVIQLMNELLSIGQHSVEWNGKDSTNKSVASGIYYYKISSGKDSAINKMLLLK
ncbi:MAG: T9SS type A sorting domain-containing protein [Candidatus Cloacimonetes bacterium]|nr:T9SS type A sorting domain-containing protein [Candidatus Cloacimonadota bacterium]